MGHPNLPATEDLRILLVTENTLLATLLCSQFRDAGGLSVNILAPGAIEERGLEKIDRGTALLLDSNAFNRLFPHALRCHRAECSYRDCRADQS
jgi:hypothetical protein